MKINKTTICIPIDEENGLDSKVSDHFGRAPFHLIMNITDQEFKILKKENDCEGDHGHCLPVDLLLKNQVTAIACKGIGKGAVNRLRKEDIVVYSTQETKVSDVLERYKTQKLSLISNQNICSGHH